jgi:hypothetical protein
MGADELLCSRNARPQKALVGRAQWKLISPHPRRENEQSLHRAVISLDTRREGKSSDSLGREGREGNRKSSPGLMARHGKSIAKQSEGNGWAGEKVARSGRSNQDERTSKWNWCSDNMMIEQTYQN